ncbi:PulJ/GspJ family protein [Pantanalinema rosaneae CENA516]|uniref:PulJ/GspJ family protein n=1 Tax=Pantanalinema rosaneae TaxID=1620701 RepID=UPI003D700B18
MARHFSVSHLKRRLWATLRGRSNAGFTLIELLVAIVIGGLITVALLSLVVDLTDVNLKDTGRTETQRDMQAALDYISQDLRGAVYVYDGTCLQGNSSGLTTANFNSNCPGVLSYVPATLSDADTTPVLAFWRADPLPDGIARLCRTAAGVNNTTQINALIQNGVPCIAGYSYSLVVYAIDTENAGNQWQGRARLVRYKLSQYPDNSAPATGTTNPAQTPGWVNPLSRPTSKFTQWPFIQNSSTNTVSNGQSTRPTGAPVALVDFVDAPRTGDPAQPVPICYTTGVADNPSNTVITPSAATNRAFYGCVSNASVAAQAQPTNQEVLLVLTGNVAGRAGFPLNTATNQARLFPIQTRVLVRGIINKTPR